MRSFVVLALVSISLGCGSGEDAPSPPPTTEPTTEPAEAAPEGPTTAPSTEPSSEPAEPAEATPTEVPICERARACCRAYVEAIPSARRPLEERGCTEMDAVLGEAGEAADDACDAAIGGWRQSLQLTGIDVPEACR